MKLDEYVRLAFYEIWQNKVRTFLTLIGIIIGISAVILIVFLIQGAEDFILAEAEKLAPSDIIRIYPRYNSDTRRYMAKLKEDDIEAIGSLENIKIAVPYYQYDNTISYQGVEQDSYFVPTTRGYYDLYDLQIKDGRFLSAEDVNNFAQVVILEAETAKEIFKHENPVGKKVLMYGKTFTVIGLLDELEGSVLDQFSNSSNNIRAFIPISTMERILGIDKEYSLMVQVKDPALLKASVTRVQNLLVKRYGRTVRGRDKFYIRDLSGDLKMVDTIKIVLMILLSGVASITLLVAGIGVMNIMLVIIAERTKEIGLRKALGATNRDIMIQFVIESIILCLVGGLIGIGVAYLGSAIAKDLIANFVEIKSGVPSWVVILSLAFTTGVGVFFGFYPALKAAKLDPIEALRYE